MLIAEYLQDHNLYLVVPVCCGKPSRDREFVFTDEQTQQKFIDLYFKNQYAAVFAYYQQLESPWDHSEDVYA